MTWHNPEGNISEFKERATNAAGDFDNIKKTAVYWIFWPALRNIFGPRPPVILSAPPAVITSDDIAQILLATMVIVPLDMEDAVCCIYKYCKITIPLF